MELFSGHRSFCAHYYEEGVTYTWVWDDRSYVMMNMGPMCEMSFRETYEVCGERVEDGVKIICARDTVSGLWAQREVFAARGVMVQYCDFKDTTRIEERAREGRVEMRCD